MPNHPVAKFGALLLTVASIALATSSSLAQTATPTTYVPTMTFDVASVRENKKADPQAGITMSNESSAHATNVRLINWNIENLISYAYGVDRAQIVGLPQWPWSTVFVIDAKGDSEAEAKMAALTPQQQDAEQGHMLQALLQDRFKLKTHWETKEGDIYNLVVAKGGPKLAAAGSMLPSADELKYFGDQPVFALHQVNDGQGYDFIAHGCSMAEWVGSLTGQFGRPVIDKTNLTAQYDFVVKYKDRWDSDRAPDDPDPKPPLDRALREQLGLKLEAAKGPVKILVIDHLEKPSEN